MVLLVTKQAEHLLFVYSAPVSTPIQDLLGNLVAIQNMRAKILRLDTGMCLTFKCSHICNHCSAIQDLLQYGPYKHPSEHGLDEEQMQKIAQSGESSTTANEEAQVVYDGHGQECLKRPDPTGRRTGMAPMPDKVATITQTVETAKQLLETSKVRVYLYTISRSTLVIESTSYRGAIG